MSLLERWVARLPLFLRRATQIDQMEIDSALSQMYSICTNPSLVNKMSRARKATKNRFYRDDPAFVVVQVLFIMIFSEAMMNAFYGFSITAILRLIVWNVGSYLFWTLALTSGAWWSVNKWLIDYQVHSRREEVDWQYSFDVHCNGYFFYFMWTKVIAFFLLPIIGGPGFLSRVIGNTVYLTGVCGYFYNLFLGYLELPMLSHQQKLLYPIPLICFSVIFSTIFLDWSYTLE